MTWLGNKRRTWLAISAAACAALGTTATPAYAAPTIVDLGTLPGGSYSTAFAINDAGAAVGWSDAADGRTHAVRWFPPGRIVDLGTLPGGGSSMAFAVNNAGVVVGQANAANGDLHAVRWDSQGVISDLEALPGHARSMAIEINQAGEIIGRSAVNVRSNSQGVRWDSSGQITDLGYESRAYAINDAGLAAGDSSSGEPVIWDRKGRITKVEHGGGLASANAGINEAGMVAGVVGLSDGTFHAVRWNRHGDLTDLDSLSERSNCMAVGINNAGTVAGTADAEIAARHAVRWDRHGKITDLETLGGNPGPYPPSSQATAINDAGIVIGSATTNSGTNAVRWDRHGRITDLGTLGGNSSSAYAINATGVVVGVSNIDDSISHAVLWRSPRP
ncbi:hypothetical protein OG205_09750 [Lentzea sp. NBC_00516]|uniref:Extracellular repeat, HAF family n=1 Tax=Lentzea sokolovensis TaxID=3095429 RepID=A0ABU4UQ77_9PSEU|nr:MULTISPECIES: hypothetical protein [unclassified Lentzea]MDX8141435.1 hypothetical protein [Lentzea sp. BCCO 10_0061]WUD27258.1 hypothetical protein OG205_09750 [Lentzea sp. NBC_00516]